jgi:hypothetical protein
MLIASLNSIANNQYPVSTAQKYSSAKLGPLCSSVLGVVFDLDVGFLCLPPSAYSKEYGTRLWRVPWANVDENLL